MGELQLVLFLSSQVNTVSVKKYLFYIKGEGNSPPPLFLAPYQCIRGRSGKTMQLHVTQLWEQTLYGKFNWIQLLFRWYFLCTSHHKFCKSKMASVLHQLPVSWETQLISSQDEPDASNKKINSPLQELRTQALQTGCLGAVLVLLLVSTVSLANYFALSASVSSSAAWT